MVNVLTLIADKAKAPLTMAVADRVARALDRVGGEPGAPSWLSAGEALDIGFAGDRRRGLGAVRAALAAMPVDAAALPADGRRKRLLVADMDSTMIGQECIDELAATIGIGETVAAITARAMRGEIAFGPALRQRVALLRGLAVETVDHVLSTRVTLTPGGRTLVATMRAGGAHTVLVSGGFTAFAAPIAAALGFDEHRANVLERECGRFTGRLAEPVLGREAKLETLESLAAARGIPFADALAVGDGANDLAMIGRAGLGVAFRAKPAVKAAADAAVEHGDLTALLYLQGFARDEFAQ